MKRLFMLCGCMSLYSLTAHSTTTTYTWAGAASANMSNSANWGASGVPLSATTSALVFPGSIAAAASHAPNNDISSNFLFNSITFGAGTTYTMTGNSLLVPGSFGASISFGTTGSSLSNPINISASTAALNVYSTGTNTLSGQLSGGGVLNVLQGQVNLGGSTQFTGSVNIVASSTANTVLQTTAANSLGIAGYVPKLVTLTQAAGNSHTATLNLNNFNQTIGGLSGTSGTTVALGTATLTLSNFGSYSTPFYGALTGTSSSSLVLENNANLALLGDLSGFHGPVTLSTGASLFTNSLGNIESFTINGGGGTLNLQLGNTYTMTQNITMNDTTTISTNGQTITYTGTLSGPGAFIKLGGGTLILNAANTNTGPIELEGGILQVNATSLPIGPITFKGYGGTLQAGSDLTVAQPIALSIAATIDTNGHTVTASGPLSGGAPFTKIGAGTLILTNSGNNFTGRTTIDQGILNATSSTFPCAAGQVQQLVFSGTVGDSTFQAASDFSNFVPSIVLQSAGIFDTNGYNVTLNGVVAGSQSFSKFGQGTLTLGNSSNNFTGNVIINNGTLNATPATITSYVGGMPQLVFSGTHSTDPIFQLGSSFPDFAADIVLLNNGSIDTTSNGYDITISGNLIGGHEYTLHTLGTGTVTFSKQSFFSGLLNLTGGTTYLNGLNACDVMVNSGAVLKGSGIGSGTVMVGDGGTYWVGASIGHTIIGNLFLSPESTTILDVNASDASSIVVTNIADIDGALTIMPEVDAYAHQGRYLLISADSLSGTFSSVSTSPGFTFDLNYQDDQIYLNYLLAISTEGLDGNALKTANYLNAYAPASIGFTQLAMLTGDTLQDALNSVSPARNGFGTYIAAQTAFSLSNTLSMHLDHARFMEREPAENNYTALLTADSSDSVVPQNSQPQNAFSGWVTGFGEYAHQSASSQNPAFRFISEAALAGFDYHPGNRGLAGGSVGYAHSYYHENHHAGHGNINYYFASLYGNAFMGDFYLSPAVWGMFNQTQNRRKISFPGFEAVARANINAWQLIPHLEAGYDIGFSWGNMVPFTAADWAISWQRSYNEHGASPFNVRQKAKNTSMVRSETGLKFSEQWDYHWGSFFLKEKASYVFEKPYGTGTVNSSLVGVPNSFTLTSVNENLNLGSVGMDFVFAIGKQKPVKIELGYEGEFGANYWSNDLVLTINKDF